MSEWCYDCGDELEVDPVSRTLICCLRSEHSKRAYAEDDADFTRACHLSSDLRELLEKPSCTQGKLMDALLLKRDDVHYMPHTVHRRHGGGEYFLYKTESTVNALLARHGGAVRRGRAGAAPEEEARACSAAQRVDGGQTASRGGQTAIPGQTASPGAQQAHPCAPCARTSTATAPVPASAWQRSRSRSRSTE